jgi:signal transduction histidine kinase
MPASSTDPRWPKVLSLTVHELRTPMTVVSGYIRMLLKERGGPLTDAQRHILEEAEKSCARLSALTKELSELSTLEAGTLTCHKQDIDLRETLRAAVAELPPLADGDVPVELRLPNGPLTFSGDPVRLAQAFTSVVAGLRREVISSGGLVIREQPGSPARWELQIGDAETLAAFDAEPDRPIFDEWRGGVGLSLAVARRLIDAHGGQLLGPPGGRKAGASILLPLG